MKKNNMIVIDGAKYFCSECKAPLNINVHREIAYCYNPQCSLCGLKMKLPRVELEIEE